MCTSVSDGFQCTFKINMIFYREYRYRTDYYIYWKFILVTSIIYIYQYNYISSCITLYKNLRCLFLLSFIAIIYMTYNVWIEYYWYVCTMPICPPHMMSFLIWYHTQNRERYIDCRHSNSWFISCVFTNILLGNFICTCRA